MTRKKISVIRQERCDEDFLNECKSHKVKPIKILHKPPTKRLDQFQELRIQIAIFLSHFYTCREIGLAMNRSFITISRWVKDA